MKHDKQQLAKEAYENLRNIFQDFNSDEPVPENLKQEVFQTLDTITLAADFIELFTAKFMQAEGDFLDSLSDTSTP